jgi:alkanesulfonate monooxygenase SsuD/methylene tetrahydromethanopterin reductase-like flavin-dependent oxidoreductase (luciferase family)
MPELGYALSSEEHGPLELVRNAVRAEQAGFGYALISDHFHPWTDRQGESAFVWGVIGGIAQATERIRIGTGVTCPSGSCARASARTGRVSACGRWLFAAAFTREEHSDAPDETAALMGKGDSACR